jgi:hypothetical protein
MFYVLHTANSMDGTLEFVACRNDSGPSTFDPAIVDDIKAWG